MTTDSTLSAVLDGPGDGTAAAIDAGVKIAGPQPLHDPDGRFFTQLVPAGARVENIDLAQLGQSLAAHPHRKQGTVHVQDAQSFIDYVGKHQLDCTEVYADLSRQKLVAVINAHAGSSDDTDGVAGHGDHRCALELLPTREWQVWTARDKKALPQTEFAEHLEDNAHNVVSPDGATMLEIASSLLASTSVDFKSASRLHDGQVTFRYEETTQARAGQTGDLDIPTTFTLSLRPFEGADPVDVVARFRYRITSGNLALSYALLNPEDIARQAFLDHVDVVRDEIAPPVFQGRPE